MTYLCHTVYFVATSYPTIAKSSAVLRPATYLDLVAGLPVGVLDRGECVPLSDAEIAILTKRYRP